MTRLTTKSVAYAAGVWGGMLSFCLGFWWAVFRFFGIL